MSLLVVQKCPGFCLSKTLAKMCCRREHIYANSLTKFQKSTGRETKRDPVSYPLFPSDLSQKERALAIFHATLGETLTLVEVVSLAVNTEGTCSRRTDGTF